MIFFLIGLCSVVASAAEFITAPSEFLSAHSATIAEIPGGNLVSCWYSQTKEGVDDTGIYCRTIGLSDNKISDVLITAVAIKEWTTGNYFQNNTVGNPVLYYNDLDKILYLFYVVKTIGSWSTSEIAFKSSKDFGQTWNKGEILETRVDRRMAGKLTRALPLRLAPDKILLPLYYETSKDSGLSGKAGYTCQIDLNLGAITKTNCHDIPGGGHLQPSLVQIGNNVYAYLRSGNIAAKIETAILDITDGYSAKSQWTKTPDLSLPNPNSSVAAGKTSENKVLLVYNSAGGRNVLNLAIADDGKNFKEIAQFENAQGTDASNEYTHPTLFRDSNGDFHLVYTYLRKQIKHIKFTEQWVLSQSKL